MPRRTPVQRGATALEFAVIAPLAFGLIFGVVDFGRAILAYTAVADAARQGARQAVANAATADNPFGTPVGSYAGGRCSGTTFTTQAAGSGCLTDAGVHGTVASVLGQLTRSVSLVAPADAATCMAAHKPAVGDATLCITPQDHGTPGPSSGCPPGAAPAPGVLGTRFEAWQSTPQYRGCYLVQVTVIYGYTPWTPLLRNAVGTLYLSSSTTLVAEY